MGLGIADRLNTGYVAHANLEALEPWRPRPSALGGCLREAAWRLSGAMSEPRSAESMRVLELGHQRGEELERRSKAAWPDAETQVPLRIPWPGGFLEGTCDLWIPSLRIIVDFKTAGAYTMGLLLAGEKEDEGYALQLNAYRHGIAQTWHDRGPAAPLDLWRSIRTVLVYEAKDSDARKGITAGMLVEQEIAYTQELEERYQARLKALHELIVARDAGALDPLSVPGMPRDAKGKEHWRCRMKNGRPLYCAIGPLRGQCE